MDIKTTPNTISIGTQIHHESITEAKAYLKENFGNKYDLDPHFNFIIMAMPDYQLETLQATLDKFLLSKPAFTLKLGSLYYEPKPRFYSIPAINPEVMDFHKELIELLNPIRDNCIREKDLIRINEGKTDAIEEEYIHKYGYLRVLDKFLPHITIGNIKDEVFDTNTVESKLDSILSNLYNSEISVNKLYATLVVDADIQSDSKFVWEKEYILS